MESNPYATPQSKTIFNDDESSEFERIRREHINHEASIKSIGFLYIIGSCFILISLASAYAALDSKYGLGYLFLTAESIALIVFTIFTVVAALGIVKLRKWGQVCGVIVAIPGVLGFPVGTLISLYIMYLLLSRKGKMIFSKEYKEVRDHTPHIKRKASKLLLGFVIVFVILIVIALILAYNL